MEKRLFIYVVLGVLVWAVLGTIVAAYYLVQYQIYQSEYNNIVNQIITYNSVVNNLASQFTSYDNLSNKLDAYNNLTNDLADQLASYNNQVERLGADVEGISTMLEGISLKANMLLSYGNGTKIWQNNTVLPLGSTAFTAIYYIAETINYTDYGGELGILVTSINCVANNSTHGWFYWYWNSGSSKWTLPSYSCAKHILHRGDTIAFTYTSYMEWPPPTPT